MKNTISVIISLLILFPYAAPVNAQNQASATANFSAREAPLDSRLKHIAVTALNNRKELGLTEKQTKKIQSLLSENQKLAQQTKEKMKYFRKTINLSAMEIPINFDEITSLTDQMNSAWMDRVKKTLKYLKELHEVFTPAQITKLKNIL